MSLDDGAVSDDSVAYAQQNAIAENNITGRNLADVPIANDADLALVEDGKFVELPLGPQLLEQADQRVDECRSGDGNAGLPFVVVEEGDCGRHHDEIEQREEVP